MGGAKVTDIGVCWSTSPNPTTSSNKLSIDKISIGKDAGSFTGSLTGLIGDTGSMFVHMLLIAQGQLMVQRFLLYTGTHS